jgi:hypothetical protein
MNKIHIIPTDKPSRLFLKENTLLLNNQYTLQEVFPKGKCQNIYITSDVEIKEGDWVFGGLDGIDIKKYGKYFAEDWKKIILTTDQDLIKDGVQAIDDNFLEWFVKNPSCDEVEVGYGWIRLTETDNEGYWVSIPDNQFEMQQEELEEVECNNCGYLMSLTEDESVYACYNSECTSCYEEYEEEPNQETLEEAACKALGYDYNDWVSLFSKDKSTVIYSEVTNWCKGAKWQQERSYSEEEVIKFGEMIAWNMVGKTITESFIRTISKELFEQFKKK